MPLEKGSSRETVSENIKTEMAHNKPQKQAVAIALHQAGKGRDARRIVQRMADAWEEGQHHRSEGGEFSSGSSGTHTTTYKKLGGGTGVANYTPIAPGEFEARMTAYGAKADKDKRKADREAVKKIKLANAKLWGKDSVGASSTVNGHKTGYEIETGDDEMGSNLPTMPAKPSGGVPASSRAGGMSVSDARRIIRRLNRDAWPMQAEKAPKMSATGAAPAPAKPVGDARRAIHRLIARDARRVVQQMADAWQEGKHPRGESGQFGPGNATGQRLHEHYSTHATGEELTRILGSKWTVARGTSKNKERYGNVITRKRYEAAHQQALAERGKAHDAVGGRSWNGPHGSGYEIETGDDMGSNLPAIPAKPSGGVPSSSRAGGMSVSDARRIVARIADAKNWSNPTPKAPGGSPQYNPETTRMASGVKAPKMSATGAAPAPAKPVGDARRAIHRLIARDAVRAGKPIPKVLQFGTAWLGTSGGSPTWQPYDARDSARRRFKASVRDACSCGKSAQDAVKAAVYDPGIAWGWEAGNHAWSPIKTPAETKKRFKEFVDRERRNGQSAGDAIARAVDAGVDGIMDIGETGGHGVPMSGWVKAPGPPKNDGPEDNKHFFKGSAADTFRRWIRRGASVADAVRWAVRQDEPDQWWTSQSGVSALGAEVPMPETRSGLAVDYGVKGMKQGVHKSEVSEHPSNKYTGQGRRNFEQKASQVKRDLRPAHEIARSYGMSVEEVNRHKGINR